MKEFPHSAEAVPAAAKGSPGASTSHLPPLRRLLNILVVDDDDSVRNVLTHILHPVGCNVTCASDGEAAWDALCARQYDGMITDNEMPRLSGLELVRRLRDISSNMPVILLSGNIPWEAPHFIELIAPGAALKKPFSMAEVQAAACQFFRTD